MPYIILRVLLIRASVVIISFYVMIRECCGSVVIVSVSKARCKMRLSLLCILNEVRLVGCGFGNGGCDIL